MDTTLFSREPVKGSSHCISYVTKPEHDATRWEGSVSVVATAVLGWLGEKAAYECLRPFLRENATCVGYSSDFTHLRPCFVGEPLSVCCQLAGHEGTKVLFEFEVRSSQGTVVMAGRHTRAALDKKAFLDKLSRLRTGT